MESYNHWIFFLSNFADEAVIIPLSLVMALTFWLLNWHRGCYGWLVAVIGTLTAIVISKFLFYVIRTFIDFGINIRSPSAHAAAGALVYGSLFALVLRGGRAGIRTAIITSGVFAVFFSFTRIELGVHTRSEVVVGSILGVLGSIAFVKIAGKMPYGMKRIRLLGASALIVLLVYGNTFRAEPVIKAAAKSFHLTLTRALTGK